MPYDLLADVVLLLHAIFVLFVVGGGLLIWHSTRWAWLHLPALAWGVMVELMGWVCPFTPLELWLRRMAGRTPDQAGVIEPYLMPILYPVGLTRETQWLLGASLIVFNVAIYTVWWRRRRRSRNQIPPPPR